MWPIQGGVGELIDIHEPLNNDTGNKLASILIQLILEKAGLADTVTFENCKQGSPYTINYILQIPNGEYQMGKPQPSLAGLTFQLLQKVLQSVDDQPDWLELEKYNPNLESLKSPKRQQLPKRGFMGWVN